MKRQTMVNGLNCEATWYKCNEYRMLKQLFNMCHIEGLKFFDSLYFNDRTEHVYFYIDDKKIKIVYITMYERKTSGGAQ